LIGVFDSGIGGLSVLRMIRERLPRADLLYVGDRGRAPYGVRGLEEVEEISHHVAAWLIDRGADCLVVACNTASAAALDSLRDSRPGLVIVGMEPAVKPAASWTRTGKVAVFATEATFQGRLFASVVARFATDVEVINRACPGWVELVERGVVGGPEAVVQVRPVVEEVVAGGADVAVLGCTHFSFLSGIIAETGGIQVIDPAGPVAAQVERVAPTTDGRARLTLAASGDTAAFGRLAATVAGFDAPVIPFP
jgi:glutamate racemase